MSQHMYPLYAVLAWVGVMCIVGLFLLYPGLEITVTNTGAAQVSSLEGALSQCETDLARAVPLCPEVTCKSDSTMSFLAGVFIGVLVAIAALKWNGRKVKA